MSTSSRGSRPGPRDRPEPYSDLSKEERVEGLQVLLGREAVKIGGTRQYGVSDIIEHVYGGRPTKDTVKQYMAEASQTVGYRTTRRNGRLVIQCHFDEIIDENLLGYFEVGDGISPASVDQLTLQAVADGGTESD